MKINNNFNITTFENILGSKIYQNLETIKFRKEQELHLSGAYIITDGELEHFFLGEDGKYIKTINCSPQGYFFIGMGSYFQVEFLSSFFKAKSKGTLKKISPKLFETLLKDEHLKALLPQFFFKYLSSIITDLFIQNTTQGDDLFRYLLKKESSGNKDLKLISIFDFIDKNNLNRSKFYRGIKNLEKNGEIKKNGKQLQLLW